MPISIMTEYKTAVRLTKKDLVSGHAYRRSEDGSIIVRDDLYCLLIGRKNSQSIEIVVMEALRDGTFVEVDLTIQVVV